MGHCSCWVIWNLRRRSDGTSCNRLDLIIKISGFFGLVCGGWRWNRWCLRVKWWRRLSWQSWCRRQQMEVQRQNLRKRQHRRVERRTWRAIGMKSISRSFWNSPCLDRDMSNMIIICKFVYFFFFFVVDNNTKWTNYYHTSLLYSQNNIRIRIHIFEKRTKLSIHHHFSPSPYSSYSLLFYNTPSFKTSFKWPTNQLTTPSCNN